MDTELGLRERKKLATRHKILQAALELFEKRGFDDVSVAEIAEAAEVSKVTVFNYFSTKENIISDVGADHIREYADEVRARKPGRTPLDAIRDNHLRGLEKREPHTGLSDDPFVLRIHKVVRDNPPLMAAFMKNGVLAEHALVEALAEESASEFSAQVMASQLMGVRHVLCRQNIHRILSGTSADDSYEEAVGEAKHAFKLLERGFGRLMKKRDES
ncbi:TetR/AcrR family transcriptional regulator [Salininema proteolyticum]|uniref:TetR/AcrR family transcriptional regulator n=1 Tax=Salininema proteolyticum TaxID=1607685 RepID=A0ABV8U5M8_9ACTN